MPSCLRWFPPAVLTVALAAVAAPSAEAQDTVRTRADSLRARADTAAPRADSAQPNIAVPRIRVPPPGPVPWRFQLDFGFQDVSGNRDLTVFNGGFTVEHRRQDRFILNGRLESRYGRSNGVTSVESQAARLRFDWRPRALVSPFLGLDANRDLIRKTVLRLQGGTGANINLDVRDARRTLVSFGLAFDYQQFTAATTPRVSRDVRFLTRFQTQRLISGTTRFDLTAKFQPTTEDARDYLAGIDAALRVSITRRMGLTTRLEYAYDSRPAPGVKPGDRSLTVALSFAW